MNCRELAELLIDYVSGELPPDHQQLVRDHLDDCPPCLVYLQTYELTIKLTRKLPCQPLPPSLADRLCKALADLRAGADPVAPAPARGTGAAGQWPTGGTAAG
jgi:anti-sigma factor RsiW